MTSEAVDIRELMGWYVCGRCKNHWVADDDFGTEYPLDFQPTALDIIYHLQRRYQYVYCRKWMNLTPIWAAWVANESDGELDIPGYFTADTQMKALEGLLHGLQHNAPTC